jgi:gamma-glutamylcyclotransferase (GGCT)/AIG2-like uncharacterized protein YtfP
MHVLVYGTLRQGDSRGGVLANCECVAPEAYLDGFLMLHLGGFPGIIPGEGRVRGEVYEIDEAVLKSLDAIEGYRESSPRHSLYLRQEVTAFDPEGEPVADDEGEPLVIFTYVYNSSRDRGGYVPSDQIIESGDWFEEKGLYERARSAGS